MLKAVLTVAALTAFGCAPASLSHLDQKDLTQAQALADFDELTATFQALYGPMTYKERRLGVHPDQLIADTRAAIQAASDDAGTFGAMKRFVAAFHDAHLNLEFPGNASGISSYTLPVFVTPVAGHAIVAESKLDDGLGGGAALGDELLTIDEQSPFALLPTILKYDNFATSASDQHYIAYTTLRPFYIKELAPTNPVATLVFAKPDGSHYQVTYPWVKKLVDETPQFVDAPRPSALDFTARKAVTLLAGAKGSLLTMGAETPFFATSQATAAYGLTPVAVSPQYLQKYSLTAQPSIYAVTYQYQGKRVLLVRQPTYDVTDAATPLNGYRAILDQEQSQADVLIIDQTHNPGGDLGYATQFFQLFVKGTANGQVEHLHADRKWIYDLEQIGSGGASGDATSAGGTALSTYYAYVAQQVDQAIDANLDVTAPFPLVGYQQVSADAQVTWTKPVLVLADELSGSCGDIFPMLMQRNGIAKIFGATTMGAGGNVDGDIATLTNSQATLNLTRGVYTTYRPAGDYSDADLVENNGVTPDYPYAHTVADFRAGFVGYVKAFSDQAVAVAQ